MSSIVNGLSGTAGLAVYIMTGLNALLLDGVFSLIAFVSSMVAFYISKIAIGKQLLFHRDSTFRTSICHYEITPANPAIIIICSIRNKCYCFCLFRQQDWSYNDHCPSYFPTPITMFPYLYGTIFL